MGLINKDRTNIEYNKDKNNTDSETNTNKEGDEMAEDIIEK